MDHANKELEAAKAAHRKLVEEKNVLKEALNSRASKVQAVIDETNRLEDIRNNLQGQIDVIHVKVKNENKAIEEIKLSNKKNLEEAEGLEEYHKHLVFELEKREMLKEKKESVIEDLYTKVIEKKNIVSNLLKKRHSSPV